MSERSELGPHSRASRVLASALAAIVCLTGGLAVSPVQAANARVRISYAVIAVPSYDWLCVGESVEISVSISRRTTVNGQQYLHWVGGGYIRGVIGTERVGSFDPADADRPIGAAPNYAANFVFVAKEPGTTDIEFRIRATGEAVRVGTGFPTSSDKVTIEVTDCYDAYTSGLATTFTEKDMRDLTEPFFLDGYIGTSTVAGTSQHFFFAPNPQNRTTGGYAFIDTAWPLAGPAGRCTAYVSGRYDVVFYGDPARPVEGDLLMKGTGVAVCAGSTISIDYTAAAGFQIGFRPRPAP